MQVKAFQFSSSNDYGLIYNAFIQYYKMSKHLFVLQLKYLRNSGDSTNCLHLLSYLTST